MRQVGIDIPSSDAGCCVVAARQTSGVGLAEDTDEVGDPFLVSLSRQQSHDHQLDAQEHENVAPFGLNTKHCGGSQKEAVKQVKLVWGNQISVRAKDAVLK